MLFKNVMRPSLPPRNEKGQFVASSGAGEAASAQEMGIGARLAGLMLGRQAVAGMEQSAATAVRSAAGPNSAFERNLTDALGSTLKRVIVGIVAKHLASSFINNFQQNIAHSQGVMGLSLSSGMGLGASQRALLTAQAFNVDPASVPGIGRNVWMSQMAAGAHGINGAPGSPEQLRDYRRRYNDLAGAGPMGLMMAQSMESQMGYEGYRPMTALSDKQFERQIARSETIERVFALSPAEIRQTNNDLVMLGATFKEFISTFKVRIAGELIPYANAAMDKGIGYMNDHADEMVAGIRGTVESAVGISRWLYMYGPPAFDETKRSMLDFIVTMAEGTPQAFGVVSAHVDDLWNRVLFGASQVSGAWDEAHARFETKLKPAFFEFIDGIGARIAPYLQLLSDPQKAVESLKDSPTGRTIARSIDIANNVTGPIADTAIEGTKSFGAPEWVQSLAGWLAPPAVGMGALGLAKWGGKALLARIFGSGAAAATSVTSATGAAGTTAGGMTLGALGATSLAAAPAAAIAGVTAAGIGVGAGGGILLQDYLKSTGYLDKDQGFFETLGHGWGRARDLMTGNWGHYDLMVQSHAIDEQRALLEERAKANKPNAVSKLLEAFKETASPFSPQSLGLVGGGRAFNGISNAPGASVAGVLSPYAPQANTAASAVRQWAMNERASMRDIGTPEQRGREFDEWKRDIKRIADNSDRQVQSLHKIWQDHYSMVARIAAYVGQDTALSITRR